jgi:hypothetical protein
MRAPIRSRRVQRDEAAFDRALALAARSFVDAPLPTAVLDAPRPPLARSPLRFPAALAAAAALLILVIGFPIGGPRDPEPLPAPVFRTSGQISDELRSAGYGCQPGATASPGEPRMEAVVCVRNLARPVAALIISEDLDGGIGEIHIKSDLEGAPSVAAEDERSDELERLIGLPFADPTAESTARTWLRSVLPLDPGTQTETTIHGVPVVVERVALGGYLIVLGDLRAGGSASPSP